MFKDESSVVVAFADAVAVLKATRNEVMHLWRDYHGQKGNTWESQNWGQLITVGYIDGNKDRPVCVSVHEFKINGRRVLVIEDTSRFVDHDMIGTWLKENWPHIEQRQWTYASNFHNIYHYITRLNTGEAQ